MKLSRSSRSEDADREKGEQSKALSGDQNGLLSPFDVEEEPTTEEARRMAMLARQSVEFDEGVDEESTALVENVVTKTTHLHGEDTRQSLLTEATSDTSVTPADDKLLRLTRLGSRDGISNIDEEEESTENNRLIDEFLEEIDFYITQDLLTDAKELILVALQGKPEHPQLKARLAIVDDGIQVAGLDDALKNESLEFESSSDEGQTSKLGRDELLLLRSLGHVSEKGLREDSYNEQKSNQDSDIHCDLGLNHWHDQEVDDAIREFSLAMDAEKNRVFCFMMIGICYRNKKHTSTAIKHFKSGLHEERITPEEAIALYYELGLTYEQLGDTKEALYYFDKVSRYNPNFRDTRKRLAALNISNAETVGNFRESYPSSSLFPTNLKETPPPQGQRTAHPATEVLDEDNLEVLIDVAPSRQKSLARAGKQTAPPATEVLHEKNIEVLEESPIQPPRSPAPLRATPPPFNPQARGNATEVLDAKHLEILEEKPPSAGTPPPFRYETEKSRTEVLDVKHIEILEDKADSPSTPPPFGYEIERSSTEILDVKHIEILEDKADNPSTPPPFRYEVEKSSTEVLDPDKLDMLEEESPWLDDALPDEGPISYEHEIAATEVLDIKNFDFEGLKKYGEELSKAALLSKSENSDQDLNPEGTGNQIAAYSASKKLDCPEESTEVNLRENDMHRALGSIDEESTEVNLGRDESADATRVEDIGKYMAEPRDDFDNVVDDTQAAALHDDVSQIREEHETREEEKPKHAPNEQHQEIVQNSLEQTNIDILKKLGQPKKR